MTERTITLLGGAGFIGSNLTRYLIDQHEHDFRVIVVDLDDDKLAGLDRDRFTFLHTSVDSDEALDACDEADVIVDLVAFANPSLYITNPLEVFDLNFVQNLRVVDLAVAKNKHLVQYSTCEVYGKPTGTDWSEDDSDLVMGPVHKQRWIYAAAKQLLERVIYAHGVDNGLDYTIIRPFNFVGPRFDYLVPAGSTGGPRVFAHYLSALLGDGPMYVIDGGEQHRSFTHIDDASRAFVTLIEAHEANRQIFNVGNPNNNVTIREFADLMRHTFAELTGSEPSSDLVHMTGEEFYGPGYEDVDRVKPNVDKLRRLGWEPKHGLEEAVRDAMLAHLIDEGRSVVAHL